MNKKLTVLASAIAVAGSAQASFDAGTTFLYVAKSGSPADTFAVDLGVGGASSAGTFAATGLSAWLGGASANFAVVGSAAGSTQIGGTPTAPSNDDSVISTASSSADGLAGSYADVQTLTGAANDWIAALNTADSDNDGIVAVPSSNANAAASDTRAVLFMSNALTDIASSSAIFASTATGDSSASTSAIGSLQVSISGDTITIADPAPIPVPAAAWLFGSALAGLTIVRRK